MSIKWYRDAGKRVLTPRRDKPKGPKSIRPKKPKKLGKPRQPGLRKPRVNLPFITAVNHGPFGQNLSSSGLSAVMKIATANALVGGQVSWHTVGEVDCPPFRKEEDAVNFQQRQNVCAYLANQGWDTMDSFVGACRGAVRPNGGNGLWALSHMNCKCYVKIVLHASGNPEMKLVYKVYTTSAAATDDQDGTAAEGYSLVRAESTMELLHALSDEDRAGLRKIDSTDPVEQALANEEFNEWNRAINNVPAPGEALAPGEQAAPTDNGPEDSGGLAELFT